MNSNQAPQVPAQERANTDRLQVVLIQHWATMVNDLREELAATQAQLATIEDRAGRMYRQYQLARTVQRVRGGVALLPPDERSSFDLIDQIFRANPQLNENWLREYESIIIGTEWNPIDLTTDEELDEEL